MTLEQRIDYANKLARMYRAEAEGMTAALLNAPAWWQQNVIDDADDEAIQAARERGYRDGQAMILAGQVEPN